MASWNFTLRLSILGFLNSCFSSSVALSKCCKTNFNSVRSRFGIVSEKKKIPGFFRDRDRGGTGFFFRRRQEKKIENLWQEIFFLRRFKKIFLKHENFQFRKKTVRVSFFSFFFFVEFWRGSFFFPELYFFVDSGMSPRKKTFCFGRADF